MLSSIFSLYRNILLYVNEKYQYIGSWYKISSNHII